MAVDSSVLVFQVRRRTKTEKTDVARKNVGRPISRGVAANPASFAVCLLSTNRWISTYGRLRDGWTWCSLARSKISCYFLANSPGARVGCNRDHGTEGKSQRVSQPSSKDGNEKQ